MKFLGKSDWLKFNPEVDSDDEGVDAWIDIH